MNLPKKNIVNYTVVDKSQRFMLRSYLMKQLF